MSRYATSRWTDMQPACVVGRLSLVQTERGRGEGTDLHVGAAINTAMATGERLR